MRRITNTKQLRKIVNTLMDKLMLSDSHAVVAFHLDPDGMARADITFYKPRDNTSIYFYPFWSLSKNNKVLKVALDLLDNPDYWDKAKKDFKDVQFSGDIS